MNEQNNEISEKIDRLAETMQKAGFNDYVEYLSNSRRVILVNLVAGLARGLGIAIGFSLLGAIAIYLLRQIAYKNIPIIGEFISEIIKIIQTKIN